MTALTAHLVEGCFVVDAPEGTGLLPLRLVVEDEGAELDDDDQARLEAFLDQSIAAADRGELVESSVFLETFRRRRR